MRRAVAALLLLGALLPMTASAGGLAATDAPGPGLAGGEWVVEDLEGRGLPDSLRITLAFDGEGRVSGHGGCNRYRGSYRLAGDALSFGAIGATRMACPPAVMEAEGRFLAALGRTARLGVGPDGALRLLDAEGSPLVLARR